MFILFTFIKNVKHITEHFTEGSKMFNKTNTIMRKTAIEKLFAEFENVAQSTGQGIIFWFARDLQHLLGYTKWQNFHKAILRNEAKINIHSWLFPRWSSGL